jgi:hypothetical protein
MALAPSRRSQFQGTLIAVVYSAFLALHVFETVDVDGEITEAHDREILEKAWLFDCSGAEVKRAVLGIWGRKHQRNAS